jgi:ubiquinone/menaquinone biosynthesis C-methylase UbiE
MARVHSADKWDTHSTKWASSVQEITKAPGRELLSMAASIVPVTSSSKIFDNGAGSGMFTSVLLDEHPGTSITAADVSSGMIEALKQNNWENVKTLVVNAMDLQAAGLRDQSFSHSFGTFFLPFVPDPSVVILEMKRVTEPGGVVAVSTWSRVSWVPLWQQAVRATVDSQWTAPDLFHTKTTEASDVQELFEQCGLRKVQVKTFDCLHPRKASPEAAADEFLNMGNPSTKLLMEDFSGEQIQQIRPAFIKAYAAKYEGVQKPQSELAVLAVGQVP